MLPLTGRRVRAVQLLAFPTLEEGAPPWWFSGTVYARAWDHVNHHRGLAVDSTE